MSRWPAPGRCKRRLARDLGDGVAARVQDRLIDHTLAVARVARDRWPGVRPRLVLAVDGLAAAAAGRWGRAWQLDAVVGQGRGSLGLRLRRQLLRAWRQGAAGVVLIGSDLPDLQVADLLAARAALESAPVVLGPALDGGYWLIGLQRAAIPCACLPLVCGLGGPIPWGGPRVLEHTLAAAAAAGLAVQLLAPHRDLDHASDLAAWR